MNVSGCTTGGIRGLNSLRCTVGDTWHRTC